MPNSLRLIAGLLGAAVWTVGGPAWAQPDDSGSGDAEPGEDDSGVLQAKDKDTLKDVLEGTHGDEEDGDAKDEDKGGGDDAEDPDATQYFVGGRFRNFIVPSFMVNMFLDGGITVNMFSAGPELSIRGNGLELDFSLTAPWADASMDDALMKSKDDDDTAWERVSSSLKILYITLDILKDIPLDEERHFSFLIGGGVGIGGVFGDIRRNQVYPNDPNDKDPEDPSKWSNCSSPGNPALRDPDVDQPYCDDANEHYGGYTEPSWANGGGKPFIFPYLALPHLAFRYSPIKWIQTRVDGGFSMVGFFFGLAAGGRLP